MSSPRLEVQALAIPDVKLVRPRKFEDSRGYFTEAYNRRDFDSVGIDFDPVQDNQSKSIPLGVVRGLHVQVPPYGQTKLVRVLSGRIFDVAVDLRRSSPTYGQHVSAELDAESRWQIWVPIGFAHGFVTLTPNTDVLYKVGAYFSAEHERAIRWNDPDIGIQWPISSADAVVSDKDQAAPSWADVRDALPF